MCRVCAARASALVCLQCRSVETSTVAVDDPYTCGQHYCTPCWQRVHSHEKQHDAVAFSDWAEGVNQAGHECAPTQPLMLESGATSIRGDANGVAAVSVYAGAAVFGREAIAA